MQVTLVFFVCIYASFVLASGGNADEPYEEFGDFSEFEPDENLTDRRCLACRRILFNARHIIKEAHEEYRKSRNDPSVVEEVIEEVAQGLCNRVPTLYDPRIYQHCREILDDHEQELIDVLNERAKGRTTSQEAVSSLCYKHLASCTSNVYPEMPPELDRSESLKSEDDPTEEELERSALVRLTRNTFEDFVLAEHDTVTYIIPSDATSTNGNREIYHDMLNSLRNVADVVKESMLPDPIHIGFIDLEHNDLTQPFSNYLPITDHSIILWPAQGKSWPMYFDFFKKGTRLEHFRESHIFDCLQQLASFMENIEYLNELASDISDSGTIPLSTKKIIKRERKRDKKRKKRKRRRKKKTKTSGSHDEL